MLCSIIIPVYQAEAYLPECLASLDSQLCQDFETILINDGSTDSSGAMCDAFAKKHPGRATVIHKENGGCLSAWRAGIATAKGDYCLFLDSDDLLDAYCVHILLEKLQQYDWPDMIIFRMFLYRNGRLLPDRFHPDLGSDILCEGEKKQLLYKGILNGDTINSLGTKMIRTSLLHSDPTVYQTNYGADDLLQTLYPLTYAKRVLYTNEPLYYYRHNPHSFTKYFDLKLLPKKNNLYVYQCIQQYLPLWGLDTPEVHDLLHARWLSATVGEMLNSFLAAPTKEDEMAVLRFPWHEFVDASRPIPDCLNPFTARDWKLYINQDLTRLYEKWSARK